MKLTRLLLSLVALAALTGVAYVNQATEGAATKMSTAAEKFLGTLNADQKAQASIPFNDAERLNWHFIPLEKEKKSTRKGLPFEAMNADQKAAALELIKSGTGAAGYDKATTIMSLEGLLLDYEKGSGPVRNTGWYFVTIFGTPSKTGPWGWRLEGHHLSMNFTMDKGQVVAATPTIFGANPAVVMDGPRKGLQPLPEAEEPVRELFKALDEDQRKVVVQPKSFPEIGGKAALPKVGEPVGLAGSKMNDKQRGLFQKVIDGYANRVAPDIAAAQLAEVKEGGFDKTFFALSGTPEFGKPWTYRIQGPTYVIEFLNEQADGAKNPANHIHSGWRSLKNDFGQAVVK